MYENRGVFNKLGTAQRLSAVLRYAVAMKMGAFPDGNRPQMDAPSAAAMLVSLGTLEARNSGQLNWKNIFEVPVLPKSTLRLLAAKAPVGSLDIDPTGLLEACGAHARRVSTWAAEQPATPCTEHLRKLTRS